MQYLSRFMARDPDFGYEIGESLPSTDSIDLWSLHRGIENTTKKDALIFKYNPKDRHSQDLAGKEEELIKNNIQRLKTLRHPDVLKFLSSVETSEGVVYLATEPATPLANYLTSKQKLNKDAILWGIFCVSRALGFLHSSQLIHSRLAPTSIFVTPGGDWKIGGFETMTPLQSAAVNLKKWSALQKEQYRSPEIGMSKWDLMDQAPASAVDSWAFGCVIYEVFNGSLKSPDELRNINVIPQGLHASYQKLLASNPANRMAAGDVKESEMFQGSKFIDLNIFIEVLAIKDTFEKEAFMKKLPSQVPSLPKDFCIHKVLPILCTHIELGMGGAPAFDTILKMKETMSDAELKKYVLPHAIKWFAHPSKEPQFRSQLIQNLEKFAPFFDDEDVNNAVFPGVCQIAFIEPTSPATRDTAVKSILSIAPKLNEKNLNNVLITHFAKLQVDPEPAIRTNTTVCIGKLASSLNATTRGKVLAPAFLRATKDPFPPARAAGLVALCQNAPYFEPREIATRLLPGVSALCIDNEIEVRSQAFKVITTFLPILEKQHKAREEAAKQNPQSNATGAGVGNDQAHQGSLSWGFNSLSAFTTALMNKNASPGIGQKSGFGTVSTPDLGNNASTGVAGAGATKVGGKLGGGGGGGAPGGTSGKPHEITGYTPSQNPNTFIETPPSFHATPITQMQPTNVMESNEFDDYDSGWGDMDIMDGNRGDGVGDGGGMGLDSFEPTLSAPNHFHPPAAPTSSALEDDFWKSAGGGAGGLGQTTKNASTTNRSSLSSGVKKKDDWDDLLGGSTAPKAKKAPPKLGAVRR